MSEEKLAFVGKQVKDIYGTFIGRVVGIITEIDGEIESVGVDCGSSGIKQMPYEQLVVQGDYVFFIPRWRLDAQRLIRQKSLTLKRIKALQEIVAENDNMKEDAELVTIKYEKKLHELEETEKAVTEKLESRMAELDSETKQVKAVLFDAKLQFRSNEMKEETYQQVKAGTDELIEHINNEKTELENVKSKIGSLTMVLSAGGGVEIPRDPQRLPVLQELVVIPVHDHRRFHPFLVGAHRDGGAMRVASGHHEHIVSRCSVVPGEDIGRQVGTRQMPEMPGPGGIWPGDGYQDAATHLQEGIRCCSLVSRISRYGSQQPGDYEDDRREHPGQPGHRPDRSS